MTTIEKQFMEFELPVKIWLLQTQLILVSGCRVECVGRTFIWVFFEMLNTSKDIDMLLEPLIGVTVIRILEFLRKFFLVGFMRLISVSTCFFYEFWV
jgi:hypothetical protein